MEGGPRAMSENIEGCNAARPLADFSILDHASLTEICSKLDGQTLVALQLVNREARKAAEEDRVWREAFKRDFPYHFQQLDSTANTATAATVPWRKEYARRVGVENRWHNGPLEHHSVEAHTGPAFGAAFLVDPLDSSLVLTGGIDMDNRHGELFLWELENLNTNGSSHTMRQVPLRTDPNILQSGIFSIRQRPGTCDVVCTTFGLNTQILCLQPCSLEETRENGNLDSDAGTMENSGDHHEYGAASMDLTASAERMHLGSGSSDGGGRLDTYNDAIQQQCGWELLPVSNLVGHTNGCSSFRVSSSKVVTASFDGTLKLFSLPPSGELKEEENLYRGSTNYNSVPCIRATATFEDDVLHYVTGVPAGVASPSAPVCGVDVSQDWTRMASGGNDMQLKLWDVSTARIVLRLPGHQGWIWNVDAEDEALNGVITTCTDGRVRSWDLRTGVQSSCINLSQNYADHVFPVSGVALRGDGRYMVVSSFDSLAYVVDRRTMRVLHSMQGHSDRLARVIVKDDTVLTLGFDGIVCRWDF